MEFDADRWGLTLFARHVANGLDRLGASLIPSALLGPYIALALIGAVQDRQTKTHPAVSVRVEHINKIFMSQRRALPPELYHKFTLQTAPGSLSMTKRIGNKLFKKYKIMGSIIDEMARLAQHGSLLTSEPHDTAIDPAASADGGS
jgi:hypothetical protein